MVRMVCEGYQKTPDELARLTLDQILLLAIKKNLLRKMRGQPGWSFEGNVSVMDKGDASGAKVRGAQKRRDKSLYRHILEQKSAKTGNGKRRRGRRRAGQTS